MFYKYLSWNILGKGVLAIFEILRLYLISNYYPGEVVEEFAFIYIYLGVFLMLGDAGSKTLVLHQDCNSDSRLRKAASVVFALSILSFIISVITLWVVSKNVVLAILASSIILMAGFGKVARVVLLRQARFKTLAIVDILSGIASLSFLLVLTFRNTDLINLIYYDVIRVGVLSTCVVILMPVGISFKYISADYLRISLFEIGSEFITYSYRELDLIVLSLLPIGSGLGNYYILKQFLKRPFQLVVPILSATIIGMFGEDRENEHVLRVWLRHIRYYLFAAVTIYFVIIICMPLLYTYYFSWDVFMGTSIFVLMCITFALRLFSSHGSLLFFISGRTDLLLKWNLVLLVSNLGLLVLIKPTTVVSLLSLQIGVSLVLIIVGNRYFLNKLYPHSLRTWITSLVR